MTVSNFFENSRRYSQVKVHRRCQRHRWQICRRYQRHRRQICNRYQRHRQQICHRYQRHRQILPPVPLVLLTPVANLPPVSTIPAANCHRYQRHRRHIMRTISGCRYLKVNLKAKIYIYVTLLLKGAQTKLLKFFSLKIFFICHRCRWHRWCTLSREYLREFSKKFEMAVMVYSDAWGKLIYEKNQKSKISWHCPFKLITFRHRRDWIQSSNVQVGPGKQRGKLGLVWRNRKKISQIINDYLYLPFFLLIILWPQPSSPLVS